MLKLPTLAPKKRKVGDEHLSRFKRSVTRKSQKNPKKVPRKQTVKIKVCVKHNEDGDIESFYYRGKHLIVYSPQYDCIYTTLTYYTKLRNVLNEEVIEAVINEMNVKMGEPKLIFVSVQRLAVPKGASKK